MKERNWTLARAGDELGQPLVLVNIDDNIQIRLPDEEQAKLVQKAPELEAENKELKDTLKKILNHVEDITIQRTGLQCTLCYSYRKMVRETLRKYGEEI
jgi:hypothetical protein